MGQAKSASDVWDVIRDQRVAMMTTMEAGKLVSRPMASLARPEDGTIYFVTRLGSDAARASEAGPVNLAYADHRKNTYLSVSGTARVSQDRAKLRELWSMWTEAWLPQGPDGDDVALITVDPDDAKLWDATSSNLLYAGKVLKAVATQTPPDAGTVSEVKL
jgi:general stress protein 26